MKIIKHNTTPSTDSPTDKEPLLSSEKFNRSINQVSASDSKIKSTSPLINEKGIRSRVARPIPFSGLFNVLRSFFIWRARIPPRPQSINKPSKKALDRAAELFERCKPEEALLLTFGGGGHSALIIWDQEKKAARYFTFSPEGANDGGSELCASEMQDYHDLLYEKNIVKLTDMDTKEMISTWEAIKSKSFNPLTNNCSACTKKILLSGIKPQHKKDRYINDRMFQMPSNTHFMALEIQETQRNSSTDEQ